MKVNRKELARQVQDRFKEVSGWTPDHLRDNWNVAVGYLTADGRKLVTQAAAMLPVLKDMALSDDMFARIWCDCNRKEAYDSMSDEAVAKAARILAVSRMDRSWFIGLHGYVLPYEECMFRLYALVDMVNRNKYTELEPYIECCLLVGACLCSDGVCVCKQPAKSCYGRLDDALTAFVKADWTCLLYDPQHNEARFEATNRMYKAVLTRKSDGHGYYWELTDGKREYVYTDVNRMLGDLASWKPGNQAVPIKQEDKQ